MVNFAISIIISNNNLNQSSEIPINAFRAKCTINLRKTSQGYKNSHGYGSCTIYVWFYLKVRNRQISNLFIGLEELSAILPKAYIQILEELLQLISV